MRAKALSIITRSNYKNKHLIYAQRKCENPRDKRMSYIFARCFQRLKTYTSSMYTYIYAFKYVLCDSDVLMRVFDLNIHTYIFVMLLC